MNVYTKEFVAECPTNGAAINYTLTLSTDRLVKVELINEVVAKVSQEAAYHESIADMLSFNLGGSQVIEATHHGVHIKTLREYTNNPTAPGGRYRLGGWGE